MLIYTTNSDLWYLGGCHICAPSMLRVLLCTDWPIMVCVSWCPGQAWYVCFCVLAKHGMRVSVSWPSMVCVFLCPDQAWYACFCVLTKHGMCVSVSWPSMVCVLLCPDLAWYVQQLCTCVLIEHDMYSSRCAVIMHHCASVSLSPSVFFVYWCWSLFVCSSLAYKILEYSGSGPSTECPWNMSLFYS